MNLLLIFSYNTSIKDWHNSGILEREILLYKKLSKKGININFLTYGNKSDLQFSNFLKNIKIFPIRDKISARKISFTTTCLFSLFNYDIFKKIDIIKTNQIDGSWLTWPLKLFFRKKLIIRCGYESFKSSIHEYKNLSRKKKPLLRIIFLFIIELISYNLADHIIMSNNYEKDFIIKYFKINPNKVSVLPNYVDTNLFRPIATEKKIKKILFIGRLNEFKNLDNLIESFKYLEDYSLDIIGKGELKPILIEKVKELNFESKINFLGTFPNSELPRIINQYNIFVLPSNMEGNPKTLLEAMSCGIACIGSNIPGINQIIKQKKNGYLCNLDSKSIANAIKYVYENSDLMRSIGKNAREDIINNYSIDKIVKKEAKIYQSLLR